MKNKPTSEQIDALRAFAKANGRMWRHHDRGSSTSIHSLGKGFWGMYGLDRNALIAEYNERYEAETGRLAA